MTSSSYGQTACSFVSERNRDGYPTHSGRLWGKPERDRRYRREVRAALLATAPVALGTVRREPTVSSTAAVDALEEVQVTDERRMTWLTSMS